MVESVTAPTDIGIDVDILRFWAYNTGAWTFRFTAIIDTRVRADAPRVAPDNNVTSTLSLQSAVAATPGSFRNTLTKALEKYTEELSAELGKRRQ